MEVGIDHRVPVTERSQIVALRQLATSLAAEAGLNEEDTHRAGLVATELGTNLVKHAAQGGEVLVTCVPTPAGPVVQLRALDTGPGIADVATALADGYSSAGTQGTGLGAIRRLSQEFDIYSVNGQGTAVLARIGRAPLGGSPGPGFEVGALCVPHAGETVSGDLTGVRVRDDVTIVALVDGLGHGPGAHDAAYGALTALPADGTITSPSDLLERMHAATRHTRGSAVSIACLRTGSRVLSFAGVGNVSGVLIENGTMRHLVSTNGTLGHQVRAFREFQYGWSSEARLILHSDGLSSSWTLDRHPGLAGRHPALMAAVLYRDFSRHRDDTTVVVVQERR